jgi:hypothetical protein
VCCGNNSWNGKGLRVWVWEEGMWCDSMKNGNWIENVREVFGGNIG